MTIKYAILLLISLCFFLSYQYDMKLPNITITSNSNDTFYFCYKMPNMSFDNPRSYICSNLTSSITFNDFGYLNETSDLFVQIIPINVTDDYLWTKYFSVSFNDEIPFKVPYGMCADIPMNQINSINKIALLNTISLPDDIDLYNSELNIFDLMVLYVSYLHEVSVFTQDGLFPSNQNDNKIFTKSYDYQINPFAFQNVFSDTMLTFRLKSKTQFVGISN